MSQLSISIRAFVALVILVAFLPLGTGVARANAAMEGVPVLFSADEIAYDRDYSILVAVGNVELIDDKSHIRADNLTYFEKENLVQLSGNVSLTDEGGNIYFSDFFELNQESSDLYGQGFRALMQDNSKLASASGRRSNNGTVVTLEKAVFSPCDVCEDGQTMWDMQAEQVVHDQEAQMITYRNARMRFLGVPFLWTPYFSHPDPSVKQKSGFLSPTAGYKTRLGWIYGTKYYYALAPDKDLTFGLRNTSSQGPVGDLEFRKRFERGYLNLKGSYTEADRVAEDGAVLQDRTRAHIEARGLYELSDTWRAGIDFFRATDKTYGLQYGYNGEDVYDNRIYAERLEGRNFSLIEVQDVQDVRLGNRDQPKSLPRFTHLMYGQPGGLLSGRWRFYGDGLSLSRSDGQDMSRLHAEAEWERKLISDTGLVSVVNLSNSATGYHVRNRVEHQVTPSRNSETFAGRFFPQAHMEASFPLVNNFETHQLMLEPVLSAATSPNNANRRLPNEDSNDIQLDITNLFDRNRFAGVDVVEDGTWTSYGLRGSYFGQNGNRTSLFLGQNYRISKDDIYPAESGLKGNRSDYVGQLKTFFPPYLNLVYNFQIDENTGDLTRNEVRAVASFHPVTIITQYTRSRNAGAVIGAPRTDQINFNTITRLNEYWTLRTGTLYDFSATDRGLRRAALGVAYQDECFNFSAFAARNLVNRVTGLNESTILFTVGFKHLGEFSSPTFTLASDEGANGP